MRRKVFLTVTALALFGCKETDNELQPFTSDGCSAFPDGTLEQGKLWRSCCVEHDFAYWIGGTEEEREAADNELEACVAAVGEPTIARLMLAGVRVGGTPWSPAEFRWGYGWPMGRGYKPLDAEERDQLTAQIGAARALVNAEKARDD